METGQRESFIVSTTEHESSIEVVPDVCAIEGRGSTSCSSASSADEDSVSHKVHVHGWSISEVRAYFYTNDLPSVAMNMKPVVS